MRNRPREFYEVVRNGRQSGYPLCCSLAIAFRSASGKFQMCGTVLNTQPAVGSRSFNTGKDYPEPVMIQREGKVWKPCSRHLHRDWRPTRCDFSHTHNAAARIAYKELAPVRRLVEDREVYEWEFRADGNYYRVNEQSLPMKLLDELQSALTQERYDRLA